MSRVQFHKARFIRRTPSGSPIADQVPLIDLASILLGTGISLASSVATWSFQSWRETKGRQREVIETARWAQLSEALHKGLPIIRALQKPLTNLQMGNWHEGQCFGREHHDGFRGPCDAYNAWLEDSWALLYIHSREIHTQARRLHAYLRHIEDHLSVGLDMNSFKVLNERIVQGMQTEYAAPAASVIDPFYEEVTLLLYAPADEIQRVHESAQKLRKGLKRAISANEERGKNLLSEGAEKNPEGQATNKLLPPH